MHISFSSILGFTTLSLLTSVCADSISIARKSLGHQGKASDAETITAINQKLSLYSLALDLKEIYLLKEVYTEDVVVDLGLGTPPTIGLDKVLALETTAQGTIPAHHVSANVYVSNITQTTASVKSDAIVTRFGQGPKRPGTNILVLNSSQIQTYYERFEDKFVKERDGEWKIKTRNLTIIV